MTGENTPGGAGDRAGAATAIGSVGRDDAAARRDRGPNPGGALPTVGESVTVGPSGMGGYLSRPRVGGPFPAVLVGFEIFGVTPYLRRMADRIAALGYLALVPDFYHRDAPGVALTADESGRERGLALMRGLSRETVYRDLDEARDWLAERQEVSGLRGMVGFSLGGHIAVLAAARLRLAAVAAFYPGWLTTTDIPLSTPEPSIGLVDGVPGRILLLVGEADHLVDATERERIGERFEGTGHELVMLPQAPHGFACDERESHRPEAAAEAWRRVEGLLAERPVS